MTPHVPNAISAFVAPLSRNVYKLRGVKILGNNAYFAYTGSEVLGNVVHLTSPNEGDAALVSRLRCELSVAMQTHLKLLPKTVSASIDGPSPSHPQLLQIEPSEVDGVEEVMEADLPQFYAKATTDEIVRRLSALLQQLA